MPSIQISQGGEAATATLQCQTIPIRRILVVDDDVCLRQVILKVLIRSGYDVDAAEDGAAGWAALHGDTYDLLITDDNMPKLTGIDLLKKLRAARMALPVIMATGTLPTHEFAQSPWLIPDATLLKPFTIAKLLGTVKEVLRATDGAREPIAPRKIYH